MNIEKEIMEQWHSDFEYITAAQLVQSGRKPSTTQEVTLFYKYNRYMQNAPNPYNYIQGNPIPGYVTNNPWRNK
jgi:hypothetical protein